MQRPTVIRPVIVLQQFTHLDGRRGWMKIVRERPVPVNPLAR